MSEEIMGIVPPPLPFRTDAKIFIMTDEEGNQIGEPYSYDDWVNKMCSISGVSPDLMGKQDEMLS